MYLGMLDLEKKHLFLDLELHIAKSDGTFTDEEKAVVEYHCVEMHIDSNNYEAEYGFNDAVERIEQICTKTEINIIFLELVAVVVADEKYQNEEQELMDNLARSLGVDESKKAEAFRIIKSLRSVYSDMNDFIKG